MATPTFETKAAKLGAKFRRTAQRPADQGSKWAAKDRFFLESKFADLQAKFFREPRWLRELVCSLKLKRNQATFKAQGPSTELRTWVTTRCRLKFTIRRLGILRRIWNRNCCSWLSVKTLVI